MNKESFCAQIRRNEMLKNLEIKTGFSIIFLLISVFQMAAQGIPGNSDREMTGRGDTTRKTIAYTLPWDGMPIDLSILYEKDKPAGKHGFLMVQGDRFVFEDGTEARFWGTNFNSAQNFPSYEHSVKEAIQTAK